MWLSVTCLDTGGILGERVQVADTFLLRLRGLLGRSGLGPGEGLYLAPCQSIHMFFMRFPIDAVFVDAAHQVVGLHASLRPWRLSGYFASAAGVLELPAGTAARAGVGVGSRLALSAV